MVLSDPQFIVQMLGSGGAFAVFIYLYIQQQKFIMTELKQAIEENTEAVKSMKQIIERLSYK